MDLDIFEQFPDQETFNAYWNENYVPVTYEDVCGAFKNFVKSAGGIFISPIMRKRAVFLRRTLRKIFHRRRSLHLRMD